jgi:hypothetical protein
VENVALKWVTEDGDIQVDAKITLNTLTIEARFLHGYNRNLALKAAYQLMTHISKLSAHNRAPPIARHIGYYGNSGFYLMPT